jgi:hypothetical protein
LHLPLVLTWSKLLTIEVIHAAVFFISWLQGINKGHAAGLMVKINFGKSGNWW